jgi:pimeloyl-ACP methyl ester carboxylesterase
MEGGLTGFHADPALPIEGQTEVDLPIDRLWRIFCDVRDWPDWNPCFWAAKVRGERLQPDATLVWAFNPIRPWYLYRLPAVATIVEFEPGRKVTWEVSRFPGFHARHSYLFDDLGSGRSRFGSWEVASGPAYRVARRFWLAHFRYVRDSSLEGARRLAGRKVRIRSYGHPTANPPLVAVPGIDGSPASIAPIVGQLSRDRQVLLVDYTDEVNPSLDELTAEAVAALREVLPTGTPIDVLGQSIGTIVAAQLVARSDLDVRRVVLIGTFTGLNGRRLRLSNLLTRLTPRFVFRLAAPLLMAYVCGPVGDGWRHPFFRASARSDPNRIIKRTRWEIGRDFGRDLGAIDRPGLVLMGEGDRFVDDPVNEVQRLRSLFVGRPVRVETIPEAGHVLLPSAAIRRAIAEIESFLR